LGVRRLGLSIVNIRKQLVLLGTTRDQEDPRPSSGMVAKLDVKRKIAEVSLSSVTN
jgi:hypothetical protein